MTSDMLLPSQGVPATSKGSGSSSSSSSGIQHSVPITDANKTELVRSAALQRLLYSRTRGLSALKRGLIDSSGLRPALTLFAGCSGSFGALFFGQQFLPVEEVLRALWFSRDVPQQLAQALLQVVSKLSEVALRTFWAAAAGGVRMRSDARVLVMMQADDAANSAGLVQFVPRLPAAAEGSAGLNVLLGQRLLLALNLGEAAYSSAAQQQARLTALELQKVLEGLQGDVRAGEGLRCDLVFAWLFCLASVVYAIYSALTKVDR
jgi:hypothetical protein